MTGSVLSWMGLCLPCPLNRGLRCDHYMASCAQKEEAALRIQQEKDRIRYGKELQVAKREEDALALKRNLEARRIEKEEERRAREKIRLKLGALDVANASFSSHYA